MGWNKRKNVAIFKEFFFFLMEGISRCGSGNLLSGKLSYGPGRLMVFNTGLQRILSLNLSCFKMTVQIHY